MAGAENVALTDFAWFRVTVQVVARAGAGAEPAAEGRAGCRCGGQGNHGVGGKVALQVAPQSIPAGELVTVPVPDPALERLKVLNAGAKSAVTFCV